MDMFLLGVTVISSETEAKAYAKFWAMEKWQMTKGRTYGLICRRDNIMIAVIRW